MFNYLNVEFPTLSIPPSRGYSLHSSWARYEHELLTVRFIDWAVPYDSISDGTPVTVNIRGVGNNRVFNGYVHHIVPDLAPDKNYVDITLIGASRILKQQSQRVWLNTTADQVIADIANANNFSYIAVPTPRMYDQISQAGLSDWEFMVKLAKQNGYSLKADNTTIIFQPLTQEFTDTRQEAAYFIMKGLDVKFTGIFSFTPMVGEAIPYADATKTTVAVSGVDRSSVTEHTHVNQTPINHTRAKQVAPIFDAYHTKVVAPTYEIAQYEATAADERNRYAYRGEAVVLGNPSLLPDSPVYLDGIGPTYSGYWTVLSVSHNIKGNAEYTTTITVGADSLGLSTQWTDNKNIVSPNETIKRVVTPGVRQKNSLPTTSLKKVGVTVKESYKAPVSKVKNVSKVSAKGIPTHQWVGAGGNLKAPTIAEKKMPAAVMKKMVNTHGR